MSTRTSLCFAEWHAAEWFAALRSIAGGRIASGPTLGELNKELVACLGGDRHVELVNAGRVALAIALATFQKRRPRRRRVIVPAYICKSVVDTVLAAGLEPLAVDIGTDLNLTYDNVAAAIDECVLAVIAPHMYACPAPIEALDALCRAADVHLVDDAAQVLGITQNNRSLGTFGDVGLLSFAQSKTIVTGVRGSGGALIVNSSEWVAPMRAACAELPAADHRLTGWAHFVWSYLIAPHLGSLGQVDYYVDAVLRRVGLSIWQVRNHYRPARMSALDAAIALPQIARLPAFVEARRDVIALYARALSGSEIEFPQFAPGRYLSKVVLLLPEGQSISDTKRRLADAGMASRMGYRSIGGATLRATMWAPRLLEVPCFSGMTAQQVERVCIALRP